MKMKLQTFTAFLLSVLILSTCSLGYLEYVQSLGIPDGYITDYERKVSNLYKIIMWPLLILAGYALYLSVISRKQSISKKLLMTVLSLLMLIAIFMFISSGYYNNFDHGQGG